MGCVAGWVLHFDSLAAHMGDTPNRDQRACDIREKRPNSSKPRSGLHSEAAVRADELSVGSEVHPKRKWSEAPQPLNVHGANQLGTACDLTRLNQSRRRRIRIPPGVRE
jgi:hypothetical protein